MLLRDFWCGYETVFFGVSSISFTSPAGGVCPRFWTDRRAIAQSGSGRIPARNPVVIRRLERQFGFSGTVCISKNIAQIRWQFALIFCRPEKPGLPEFNRLKFEGSFGKPSVVRLHLRFTDFSAHSIANLSRVPLPVWFDQSFCVVFVSLFAVRARIVLRSATNSKREISHEF